VSDPGRGGRSGSAGRRASRALTPDELRQAIEELVDELIGQNVPARLTIYGGAAMALVHYERAATVDIDASFLPPEAVSDAATAVAGRRGLGTDWLNNAATAFLPPVPDDHPAPIVIDRGGVVVTVASAQLLLAMKLRASRPGRDGDDIAVLVRACGLRSVAEAQQLMDEIYLGEEQIPGRGHALLERAFGQVEIRLATGTTVLPAVGDNER
jgi:hypothetical protein